MIVMIFIPLFTIFASLYIEEKLEKRYRLKKIIFATITIVLLVMVMTNDLHIESVANAGLALSMCRNQQIDLILITER